MAIAQAEEKRLVVVFGDAKAIVRVRRSRRFSLGRTATPRLKHPITVKDIPAFVAAPLTLTPHTESEIILHSLWDMA